VTLIEVFPSEAPFAPETRQLVDQLRQATADSDVLVGGRTASLLNDLQASLLHRLPTALLVLAVVTFLALFAMTGSVVIPIKALLMSALTVVAALGTLVIAFQWGALEWLLGPAQIDGLESTQPVLLFALAFGLSTDYEVFLLSRIKEARDNGAGDDDAVAAGLQRSGRIVTAAALLFCLAFVLFASSRIEFLQQLGIGTAVAVVIDAMIVRALLVPSLMKLLGARNWWSPPLLQRLHRRLRVAH
jgi:RND superfamily putative drug exporter